jgi:diguanylate cyclase (GGDEF)-like protein
MAELGLQWELQQRLLAWDASHDRLTRLVNRVELQDRLDGGSGPRAVLFCDLDDFKPINDSYGHRYGDAVLVAVARRLELNARPHLAARLGGDEFAVLIERVDDADAPVQLAQRLIGAVSQPIDALGVRAQVGLSIGVAVDLSARAGGDAVLHAADVALRRAKADGKGRVAWTISQAAAPG